MKIYIKQADSTFSFAYNQKAGFTLIKLVPATANQTEAHLEFFSKNRNKYKPLFAYEISSLDIQEQCLDEMEVIFQGSGKAMQFQVNSKTGKEFPLRPISNSTQDKMVVPQKGVALSSDNLFLEEDSIGNIDLGDELPKPENVKPILSETKTDENIKDEIESFSLNNDEEKVEPFLTEPTSESLEAELGINSSDENVFGIIPQIGEFDEDVDLLALLEQSESNQDEIIEERQNNYEFLDDLNPDSEPLGLEEIQPVAEDFVDTDEMEQLLVGDFKEDPLDDSILEESEESFSENDNEDSSEEVLSSDIDTTFIDDFELSQEPSNFEEDVELSQEASSFDGDFEGDNFELTNEDETFNDSSFEITQEYNTFSDSDFEIAQEDDGVNDFDFEEAKEDKTVVEDFSVSDFDNSNFELLDEQEGLLDDSILEESEESFSENNNEDSSEEVLSNDIDTTFIDDFELSQEPSNFEEDVEFSQEYSSFDGDVEGDNFELPNEDETFSDSSFEITQEDNAFSDSDFEVPQAEVGIANVFEQKERKKSKIIAPEKKITNHRKEQAAKKKIEKLQQKEMEKRIKEQKKIQKRQRVRSIVPGVIFLLIFGISALVAFFVVKYLL